VKGKSVTIAEVARAAGVSTATAGRVLGGYGYSSAQKRSAVLEAAEALGYRPNLLARSLITGHTRTLGVVAGDIESPFYAAILRGIANVAETQSFGLLITNSDENVARELRAVELLQEKQVDGLIVSPCDTIGAAHLREAAARVPVVLIDREVEALEVDSVGADNIAGAQDCVAGLLAAGHRRIGFVAELETSPLGGLGPFLDAAGQGEVSARGLYPSWQRLLGYIRAHQAAGVPLERGLVRRVGQYSVAAAEREAAAMIDGPGRPSAVFTGDGLMSSAAMAAVRAAGLAIPRDLSMVGFDDLDWMAFVGPGIDAVAQPRRAMGETAARMLLERVAGLNAPPRRVRLATRRMRRGSIGPPPGRAGDAEAS